MHPDEDLTETFKALSHPLRQDIIFILAESHNGIGFTALQTELNQFNKEKRIQVGTIYHHVKLLGDLIDQKESSKWVLSKKGWAAYNLLTSSQDRNQFLKSGDLGHRKVSFFWKLLAPPELFLYIKKSPLLFIGWQIIFIIFFAFITSESNLILFFVFFAEIPKKNYLETLVSIIFSWILFSGINLLLSKLFLKRKIIHLIDIAVITIFLGLSLLPLVIFPILIRLSLLSITQPILPLALVIILQLWVIILTARGISVQFFVRMDRAGMIALISVYIMMILGLILGF